MGFYWLHRFGNPTSTESELLQNIRETIHVARLEGRARKEDSRDPTKENLRIPLDMGRDTNAGCAGCGGNSGRGGHGRGGRS